MSTSAPQAEIIIGTGTAQGVRFVRYGPGVEVVEPGEPELFRRIADVMTRAREVTEARYGRPVRASHLTALGIVRAALTVSPGLAPEGTVKPMWQAGRQACSRA